MSFAAGQNVGTYRIVEQLGQGGMATVFKAYHPALDRYVAIKVLHPAFKEDPNFITRFHREARIVAKLDHPNIIPIYDFAEHEGTPYLVIRYVEGKTLKAIIREGLPPLEQTLKIIRPVTDALAYAHAQGVLHRDIKPSNIIIANDGHVYLADFGLARMAQAGESTLSHDMLIGTPQYISPEQAKGEPIDERSDIYSLGVVLFEMLTGRVPFSADTPYSIIHDHIYKPLPMPRTMNPALSLDLERVVLKALAKDPSARFGSAAELMQAFDAAVSLTPSTPTAVIAPPPSPASPLPVGMGKPAPKKRAFNPLACAIIALVVLLLVVVAGGLLVLQRGDLRRIAGGAAQTPAAAADLRAERTRVAANPNDPDAHIHLGDALARVRENEAAAAEYETAIRLNPKAVNAYVHAGELAEKLNKLDYARDIYLKGVSQIPDNQELRLQLADIYVQQKAWEDARLQCEKVLTLNPKSVVAMWRLGDVFRFTNRQGDAISWYMKAIEIEPNLAEAHYGLAVVAVQQNQPDKARREFNAVIGNPNASQELKNKAEQQLKALDSKK